MSKMTEGTGAIWSTTFLIVSLWNDKIAKERHVCRCSCARNICIWPQRFASIVQNIQDRYAWYPVRMGQYCIGSKEKDLFCHLWMRLASEAKRLTAREISKVVNKKNKKLVRTQTKNKNVSQNHPWNLNRIRMGHYRQFKNVNLCE